MKTVKINLFIKLIPNCAMIYIVNAFPLSFNMILFMMCG